MGATLYNTLPKEVTESHDINCFKKSLKILSTLFYLFIQSRCNLFVP